MPVKDSYRDRVFTTEVSPYPGMVHIGETRISPRYRKALELAVPRDTEFTGINAKQVMTGFAHGNVSALRIRSSTP